MLHSLPKASSDWEQWYILGSGTWYLVKDIRLFPLFKLKYFWKYQKGIFFSLTVPFCVSLSSVYHPKRTNFFLNIHFWHTIDFNDISLNYTDKEVNPKWHTHSVMEKGKHLETHVSIKNCRKDWSWERDQKHVFKQQNLTWWRMPCI